MPNPKRNLVSSLVAVVAVMAAPLSAQVSTFCTAAGSGKFSLPFDIAPSLVVNSDGVMDATRGSLGLDGAADERAFSFRRTIGALLASAGAPADDAARIAFVQTLLGSFNAPARLNAEAGVFMPLDVRPAEAGLSAAALLDEASPDAMVPLALFNRLDLAPETWSSCGEYRIVYGKNRVDPTNPTNRFLLIFEAMVPNPDPAAGEAGCRRVSEFWAGLSGKSEADQAAALSAFYYDGVTGHPDGNLQGPVVDFRNYGGDGNRGQVRANAFITLNWQLREWLTQLTFASSGPALAFVPVTVKDNPLSELYRNDIASVPAVAAGNLPAALTLLHGQFAAALTADIAPNLLSEGGAKHAALTAGLAGFDLGASPVTEEDVLLGTIALGNADKFNEHQSTSQGAVDVPGAPAAETGLITALLQAAGQTIDSDVPSQSGQVLLNRARAATCGGCHMTAARSNAGHFTGAGVIVRENADASVVRWPDVHSGGFVHVNEPDRALSAALTDSFLPFRRYVMGRHLCADLPPPAAPDEDMPAPYAQALSDAGIDVPAVATSARFVDAVMADYLSGLGKTAATGALSDGAKSALALAGTLDAGERAGLQMAVSRAISVARSIELEQVPGAFVETRRPH
ncbi:MAG: hypothetical protein V4712_10470 [Pseudomonadota bacterium]